MSNLADVFYAPDLRMTSSQSDATPSVTVDAPSRLHLGFLDPSGSLGRRFASLGMVIEGFDTRIEMRAAERSGASVASCLAANVARPAQERMARYLEVLQRETGLHAPASLQLQAAPPAHSGFGSGTQLALACGRAFCQFHGLDLSTRALAAMLGRGERSGVGLAGFDQGGLLLDGGPGADGTVAPLISRIGFPDAWRVLLLLDDRIDGLSGKAERVAMERLPPFPRSLAADLCHQVLMRVLPGALEGDFEPFAEGVSALQRLIGDYFAPAQGGSMYTSAAVGRALEWVRANHQAGIGQSSWGPTGFAIVRTADEAESILGGLRAAGVLDPALRAVVVRARNRGATIRRP
ncbi:beta-ribofuranosylaminobenzene 5'-phosphate synthase family protein [Thauera sp.]|nr:beta-ribofuranosylaminobenzene 5'-phosphate synthase family protein [Thauera sp.]